MLAPDPRAATRQRLGLYLLGVAIGCVLLGLYWSIRARLVPPPDEPSTPAPATDRP